MLIETVFPIDNKTDCLVLKLVSITQFVELKAVPLIKHCEDEDKRISGGNIMETFVPADRIFVFVMIKAYVVVA